MDDSSFSNMEMLHFLIFLNKQIDEGSKTEFTIWDGNYEEWNVALDALEDLDGLAGLDAFAIHLSHNLKFYLTYLSKLKIIEFYAGTAQDANDMDELIVRHLFAGTIINFLRYHLYFEALLELIQKDFSKAEEEKKEILGFSPLVNSKQIKKTKKDVQAFLKISKENKTLSGFVDEVTELIKNIDSIEKINDNYIDVYKNIIKPMKDETDKSLKAIKDESKKGTDKTVKVAIWSVILSVGIPFIIQHFNYIKIFFT